MNTTAFGPCGWKYMFYVAAGFDLNETPIDEKKNQYKIFFQSIGNTIPCKYCRQSYAIFYKNLSIDRYMDMPSCGLIRFVYDLRSMVNDKLVKQETKVFEEEFKKLLQDTSPDDPEFWKIMRDKGHKICYTKPNPSFEQVVADIMKDKAGCSAHMKTCREPLLNNMYPPVISTNFDPNTTGRIDKELYLGGSISSKKSLKFRKRKSNKTKRNKLRSLKHKSRKSRFL